MSSLYNILMKFIHITIKGLQNIQTRGQYANCNSKNDFINILSLEKLKTLDSLDIAVNFLPSEFT